MGDWKGVAVDGGLINWQKMAAFFVAMAALVDYDGVKSRLNCGAF
jgi:hypothetical protein